MYLCIDKNLFYGILQVSLQKLGGKDHPTVTFYDVNLGDGYSSNDVLKKIATEYPNITPNLHRVFIGRFVLGTSGFYILHSYGGTLVNGYYLYCTGIMIGINVRYIFGTIDGTPYKYTINVTQ